MKLDYTRYYLKWHSDTPAHREAMVAFYLRTLRSHLPPDRTVPVIDIGCGMGFTLEALKRCGFGNLSGVEYDEGQVAACRKLGLDVALSRNTSLFLRERAGSYGLAVCLDVLEHIPIPEQLDFAQSIGQALRPGGRLLLTVPNASASLAPRWRFNDWTHSSAFTEDSLEYVLAAAGFHDIQIAGVEFVSRPKRVWLPIGGVRHWWAFRFFRMVRRMQLIAELGAASGRTVPLSLNLLAVAGRPN